MSLTATVTAGIFFNSSTSERRCIIPSCPQEGQHLNYVSPSTRSKLSASLEDYLEAIYNLIAEKNCARGKDIAARLSVSGASVTEALRSLAKKGLINYAPYEAITLTLRGRRAAQDVVRRHDALKQFFVDVLGIDEDLAEKGACRVEHAAPQPIIDQMVNFINYLESCPEESRELIRNFSAYCQADKDVK